MARFINLNDSEMRTFLIVVFAFQLIILGIVVMHVLGLHLPILEEVALFTYLTFLPGIIILRILRIHSIDTTKFVLYSVGLSITFTMFVGALANYLLHALNVLQPMRPLPLTLAIFILTTLLCILAYFRDKGFVPVISRNITVSNLIKPSNLILLLLPLLAFWGTYLVNFYGNNTVMLLLYLAIACIVILIVFDKYISRDSYPLAIFTIAISVVYCVSLLSPYRYWWNIDYEYYYSQLVVTNGYWDPAIGSGYNSLLSIVILPPAYSLLLNIDLNWIFKAVVPFFQALIPLAIYAACREQIGAKKAFLACIFYLSVPSYLGILPLFMREQIAELILALLILVIIDAKLNPIQRSFLFITFIIVLPVSHYGTTYITLGIFFVSWFILYLLPKIRLNMGGLAEKPSSTLRFGTLLVGLIFMLFWFIYVSGGASFNAFISVVKDSLIDLRYFFDLSTRPPILLKVFGLGLGSAGILGNLFRFIHYTTQALIITGFLSLIISLINPKIFYPNLKNNYKAILVTTTFFLLAAMFLPFLVQHWHYLRLYGLVLVIIAPLIVFGAEFLWRLTSWLMKNKLAPLVVKLKHGKFLYIPDSKNDMLPLRLLSLCILIPYFLFTYGFVGEIAEGHIDIVGVPQSAQLDLGHKDSGYFNDREMAGASWLGTVSSTEATVSCDPTSEYLLNFWFPFRVNRFSFEQKVTDSAYIYLRTWNIERAQLYVIEEPQKLAKYFYIWEYPEFYNAIYGSAKIYDNGGAQVFATRKY